MKKSRGFTLLEMSVALAVAAIALGMLATIMFYANSFTKTKQFETAVQREIVTFHQTFAGVLEDFQSPNFQMQAAGNEIVFESAQGVQTIKFFDGKLWQNDVALQACQYIENANFSVNQKLISCTLIYGEHAQTLVFFKRI
ncbi:MAG: prepilin-type N-terminal cleavage/methylation domain-containing protein [Clostridia bacterium]